MNPIYNASIDVIKFDYGKWYSVSAMIRLNEDGSFNFANVVTNESK